MVSLEDPRALYDAGDILRRDGACEQRGRFERDTGRYDVPGEVFGACAGAALYRRRAVLAAGGFDDRFFAYLEDVELALKLRLEGWRCRYEPVIARHAGGGSSHQLRGGPEFLVQRNTLVLVARWFPLRWLPLVVYRQLGWAREAARARALRSHLRASRAALPLIAQALRERRVRPRPPVAIDAAVPRQARWPFHGTLCTKCATTSFASSWMAAVPGKREAVWPSSPIPRKMRPKASHFHPPSGNALRRPALPRMEAYLRAPLLIWRMQGELSLTQASMIDCASSMLFTLNAPMANPPSYARSNIGLVVISGIWGRPSFQGSAIRGNLR